MGWMAKTQQRLQANADKLFKTWLETNAGKEWLKTKKRRSPSYYGFTLPDYHHLIIHHLGKGDEETVKYLIYLYDLA